MCAPVFERGADAVPCGQGVARLRPAEHPWDRAYRRLRAAAFVAVARARADVEQTDLAAGRRLVEIIERARRAVGELAIPAFARRGELVHDGEVILAVGDAVGDEIAARAHHAGDAHGELVHRRLAVAVFVRQHLALLGELDLTLHRARRLREDGFMRGAAAASHRAAAAVKYTALHAARAGDRDDLLLRLVELPRRGDDAAVLARIGITQHHLLLLARDLQ